MSRAFEGKVAVVTGGSAGIGRATALAFAAEGARVAVASRRPAQSEETVELIAAQGGEAMYVQTDVSIEADVERLIKTTTDRWGRLDYAFNNAGVIGTPFVDTGHYTEAAWDQVLDINLKGVFLSLKHEIPAMLAAGGGAIVNMSSVAGQVGGPVGIAYYASKHGVIGCTKAAALEYAPKGIRINAVCPAVIETEMAGAFPPELLPMILAAHPLGRFGSPEEVASVVVFLCSDKASFITGHALPIDAGFLSR
ncbi:MAG: SDR family oxidoreductase [Acidobacteriota bacterium]